jgi:hypothetical protein
LEKKKTLIKMDRNSKQASKQASKQGHTNTTKQKEGKQANLKRTTINGHM